MTMIVIVHSPEKNAKHHSGLKKWVKHRVTDHPWKGDRNNRKVWHKLTAFPQILKPVSTKDFPQNSRAKLSGAVWLPLSLVFIRSNNIVPVCSWWCSTPNCVLPGPSSCVDSRLSWRRTVRNKVERVSALVTWWTSPKYGYTPETAIT